MKTAGDPAAIYLVTFGNVQFPYFFHLLACCSFLFPVKDGGRLLEIFSFFPLTDDSFFLHHAFKTLD